MILTEVASVALCGDDGRVAVEMGGTSLEDFEHPDRAIYLLGSEDAGRR